MLIIKEKKLYNGGLIMKTNDLDKTLKQKSISKLQNLSLEEGKELLSTLPDAVAMRLYARNCTKEEIKELVKEWSNVCPERIEKLRKAFKKERKPLPFSF